jgi:hypothetical protein
MPTTNHTDPAIRPFITSFGQFTEPTPTESRRGIVWRFGRHDEGRISPTIHFGLDSRGGEKCGRPRGRGPAASTAVKGEHDRPPTNPVGEENRMRVRKEPLNVESRTPERGSVTVLVSNDVIASFMFIADARSGTS